MKTFAEFLKESISQDIIKVLRKAIGKGKTKLERGIYTLHADPNADEGKMISDLDKATGVKHEVDKFKRPTWKTGDYTVVMSQHSDGHFFFEVF